MQSNVLKFQPPGDETPETVCPVCHERAARRARDWRFMRRLGIFLILVAMFGLTGCAGEIKARELSKGVHRVTFIETDLPGGGGTQWQTQLTDKSMELCPGGFEKVKETVVSNPAGGNITAWDVRCRQ